MTRWSVAGFRRDKMRSARRSAGLSRADLAAIIDCAESTVRGWEDGTAVPHGPYLRNLADALGITVPGLLDEPDADLTLGDLRARAGLLQADAAAGLGVSVPTLSETERGNRPVPDERISALASLYGVPVEQVRRAARVTRERRRDRARVKAARAAASPNVGR
jgi:transcriptional regulator with XRE-family HTH domain